MGVSIFNNDIALRLREVYDDYRITGAAIRQGYNVDYPYIMDLYDDDMEVIKSINVQMQIVIGAFSTRMSMHDDCGKNMEILKVFK